MAGKDLNVDVLGGRAFGESPHTVNLGSELCIKLEEHGPGKTNDLEPRVPDVSETQHVSSVA
jgi:hypothetical protein